MKALVSIEIAGNTVTLENGLSVSLDTLEGCTIFKSGELASAEAAQPQHTLENLETGVEAIVASGQFEGYRVMRAGEMALYRTAGDDSFQEVPSNINFEEIVVRLA